MHHAPGHITFKSATASSARTFRIATKEQRHHVQLTCRARRWQAGMVATVLALILTLGSTVAARAQDEEVDLAARAYPLRFTKGRATSCCGADV